MIERRLVCDASAIVTVLLESGDAGTWLADRLAGSDLFAPALFPFECSNVIRRHELGGLISSDQAAQAHADLLDRTERRYSCSDCPSRAARCR